MKKGQTAITVNNRRRELLTESAQQPLSEAIKQLSVKYACSEDALYADWADRDKWINEIFSVEDPTLPRKYFAGLERVVNEAWWSYRTADNSNAKVGALRVAKETYGVMLEILVKAGILTRQTVAEGSITAIHVTFGDPLTKAESKPEEEITVEQTQ